MSCKVLSLGLLTLLVAVVGGAHGVFVGTGVGVGGGFPFWPFGGGFGPFGFNPFSFVFGGGSPFFNGVGGPLRRGQVLTFGGFGPGGVIFSTAPGQVRTFHTLPGQTLVIPSRDPRGGGGVTIVSNGGGNGHFSMMTSHTSF